MIDTAPERPRAVSLRVDGLKKRSEFLRAARGRRVVTDGFILQANRQPEPLTTDALGQETRRGPRFGITCSKKVGNAVVRNRAKRRLREIARLELPQHAQPDFDYVLIGRADRTAQRDFEHLREDLRRALRKIHGPSMQPNNKPHSRTGPKTNQSASDRPRKGATS